jgi:hypothetical protein
MPRYWIKNAGTVDEPVPADWYRWGKNPEGAFGDPNLFSRRPTVEPGDRLVFYAVGSAAQFKTGRIFAVVEVTSEPEPSGHDRWPWQVRSRMLVPGPRLPNCPTIDDIDVAQTSLRRQSHISLDEARGKEAERLIARAAERAGSVGHCYKGPPAESSSPGV